MFHVVQVRSKQHFCKGNLHIVHRKNYSRGLSPSVRQLLLQNCGNNFSELWHLSVCTKICCAVLILVCIGMIY
jgi:hypothetical protein